MWWMWFTALVVAVGCSGDPDPRRPRPDSDDTDTDTGVGSPSAALVESGVIPCADGQLRGPNRFHRLAVKGDWDAYEWELSAKATAVGGGVGVADLDGDGALDIVLPGDHRTVLFHNAGGGRFLDVSDAAWPAGFGNGRAAAAIPVDYDGDGDKDVYLLRYTEPNRMFRNRGDGTFEDSTEETGLAGDPLAHSAGAAWADYDGDGDLDVFVSNYGNLGAPQPPGDDSVLYRNNGNGTFRDVSRLLDATDLQAHTFIAGWHDLNGDRYPELYVVNDFGWQEPNPLYWNRRGALRRDDGTAGLGARVEGMGLAMGDLNGDEVPDFVVAAWDMFRLYESAGDGRWFENHKLRGIDADKSTSREVAWGVDFADLDHDMDLDLLVMNGFLNVNVENSHDQPDSLFVQQPDGTFVQSAEQWGLTDTNRSRGFAFADLNDDGWLDFVQRDAKGPQDIWMARCRDEGAWLRIRLHAGSPNTDAIGAKVRVRVGDTTLVRWMTLGSTNFASAGPTEVHFGLAGYDRVDRIEVVWPDGDVGVWRDVATRQILDITQP